MRVSVEAVRVSIEALRCFWGRERLEEVPVNVNWGHESVLSRPHTDTLTAFKALSRQLTSTFSRLWECCWGRESVVYSLFCNSLIEGSGCGSIPLTNGSGSERVDPDPDTDRNESTNVPISKLRIETKPKRFDVFQNPGTFLFIPKILEQNQNFMMCSNFCFAKAKRSYFFKKFWNKTKTFWCVPTFF